MAVFLCQLILVITAIAIPRFKPLARLKVTRGKKGNMEEEKTKWKEKEKRKTLREKRGKKVGSEGGLEARYSEMKGGGGSELIRRG